LGFNAVVQPAPVITAFGPTTGLVSVGASVVIGGTDFEGATAVKFGSIPAPSFTVNSEGQIVAVAPPAAAGAVNLSVSTIAGTATSTQPFTYSSPAPPPTPSSSDCVVPNLHGRKLRAAKKRIRKADCKLGTIKEVDGVTAKTGEVVKQNPKPGKVLAPGSKIKVKLG
jgi:hypothetical protein